MLTQSEILKLVHTIQIETRKTMHSEMKILIEKEMRKMVREEMRVIAEPLEEDISDIKEDTSTIKRIVTKVDKKHDALFNHLDKFTLRLLTAVNRIEKHLRLPLTSLEESAPDLRS